jgi:hypothetical protein
MGVGIFMAVGKVLVVMTLRPRPLPVRFVSFRFRFGSAQPRPDESRRDGWQRGHVLPVRRCVRGRRHDGRETLAPRSTQHPILSTS